VITSSWPATRAAQVATATGGGPSDCPRAISSTGLARDPAHPWSRSSAATPDRRRGSQRWRERGSLARPALGW